ncbi:MAG TPA: YdcF family protein [Candidatus Methylacidiphilales bacterium]|jgi:vancomycin permeability regulator SanA|nr:YdcF family protein [Candidatus Methylacidiphilales bacterium]
MRRVLRFVFKLLALALVIFLLTALGIVLNGLSDAGQKADAALVMGDAAGVQGQSDPRLDRAVELYNDQEFPFIIVGGSASPAMTKYLERHGIPSSAIIEDHQGETTEEMAHRAAGIVASRQFQSVMIVTEYYRMTLAQLALTHEGVAGIQKAHVGKPDKADAWEIARATVALYEYIGKTYLLPAAEKAREEAQDGIDNIKKDGEKAKDKVNKGLDSLPK